MNLAQLRTQTRRYAQDVAGVEWSDPEMNLVINDSYYDLQMELQMSNPEAIVAWDKIDITANESWYPKPPTFGLISVSVDLDNQGIYTKLVPGNYEDVKSLVGTGTRYCERGDWIGIFPATSTGVTNGIEVLHRPIDTLTADSDIPKLKLPVHQAICLQAKVFLLGDTNENAQQDEKKLEKIKERMPLLYMGAVDEAYVISPRGL